MWLYALIMILAISVEANLPDKSKLDSDEDTHVKISSSEYNLLLDRLDRLEIAHNTSLNAVAIGHHISSVHKTVKGAVAEVLKGAPATDPECSFDYIQGVCVPRCDCTFVPKLGDYTLSRACRLHSSTHDGSGTEKLADPSATECDSSKKLEPWVIRLSKRVIKHVNTLKVHIKENAPATDEECTFSLSRMNCVPSHSCVFDYHYGDYSLSRACRLILDDTDLDKGMPPADEEYFKMHQQRQQRQQQATRPGKESGLQPEVPGDGEGKGSTADTANTNDASASVGASGDTGKPTAAATATATATEEEKDAEL
jgi:hypothetical protein